MITQTEVIISETKAIKEKYEAMGYIFNNKKAAILLEDLPSNSSRKIKYKCDNCGKECIGIYARLIRSRLHSCENINCKQIINKKLYDLNNFSITKL